MFLCPKGCVLSEEYEIGQDLTLFRLYKSGGDYYPSLYGGNSCGHTVIVSDTVTQGWLLVSHINFLLSMP